MNSSKKSLKKKSGFTLPEISVSLIVLFIMTVLTLKYYLHERKMASIDTFKVELATIIDAFVFGGAGGVTGYIYGASPKGFCSAYQNYLDGNLTMGRLYLCISEDYNYSILHNRVYYGDKICGKDASMEDCNSTDTTELNSTYFKSIYAPNCMVFVSSNLESDGNRSVILNVKCDDDNKTRQARAVKSVAFLERIQGRQNPKLGIPIDVDAITDGNFSIKFPENQL